MAGVLRQMWREGVGEGMVGTSQTTIFWAVERSTGFILLGPVNPWRVLSGKPRDLIFKSSPDLNSQMEKQLPFHSASGDGKAPGASEGLRLACRDGLNPALSYEPT